jgi:hypothetical protein
MKNNDATKAHFDSSKLASLVNINPTVIKKSVVAMSVIHWVIMFIIFAFILRVCLLCHYTQILQTVMSNQASNI